MASLIVVPDGPFHLIPFSALVNKAGGYLSSEVTLSAVPSATIYYTLNKTPRPGVARKPFLGVAFSPPAPVGQVGSDRDSRAYTDLRREV